MDEYERKEKNLVEDRKLRCVHYVHRRRYVAPRRCLVDSSLEYRREEDGRSLENEVC